MYRQQREDPRLLPGQLGIILLQSSDSEHSSVRSLPGVISHSVDDNLRGPQCKRVILPRGVLNSQAALQFSNNDCRTYRDIVDVTWDLIHDLYVHPPSTNSRSYFNTDPREVLVEMIPRADPQTHFQDLLLPLELCKSVNPVNQRREQIENDGEFFGILNNQDFGSWLESPGCNILRIVATSDWNLTAFCSSLSGYVKAKDYDVLHLDGERLSKIYGPENGYWNGTALVGPLLLRIFKFIIDTWASRSTGKPTTTKEAIVGLLQRIIRESGATPNASEPETDLMPPLVNAIEHLGSNLVKVIADSLYELRQDGLRSTKLMIVISGLHGFQKTPELGRIVHCVRKLHEFTSRHCLFKTLFAHEPRDGLDGLLSDVTCISDDERLGD